MTVHPIKTAILFLLTIFWGGINSEPDDATVCADNGISMVFYNNLDVCTEYVSEFIFVIDHFRTHSCKQFVPTMSVYWFAA
jgi:hypothetical protein